MMYSKLYVAVAAALVLGGCSLIPDYHRPDSSVAQTWPVASPKVEAAQMDLAWEHFFTEPGLQKLIQQALDNNRDLQVAILNIRRARAQFRITRSDLLPSVNAAGSGTNGRTPADLSATGDHETTHQYDANVGFSSYELDLFGRVRSLSDQALESYLSTVEARRAAQISLISEVASAWYQLQFDYQNQQIAAQTLHNQQENYNTIKSSYEANVATELDLSQARSTVQSAKVAKDRYARLVMQDRNALVLLVGKSLKPEQLAAVPLEHLALVDSIKVGLPSEVLIQRPDILEADHQLRAANANIGAARAAFFPSITLTATAGSASSDLGQLFSGGQGAWSFVPSINLPIFNYGRNRANLDMARIEKSIEIANYQQAIQTAFREVSDGLAGRDTLKQQVEDQRQLVAANAHTYDLAQARYQAGVDTFLNTLDAQRSLFSSQQDLMTTELQQRNNLISLFEALGGGGSVSDIDKQDREDAQKPEVLSKNVQEQKDVQIQ